MARKTAKSVYKNLTFRDLTIIVKKQAVLTELIKHIKEKEEKASGWGWVIF
jgi:hypothetical protein